MELLEQFRANMQMAFVIDEYSDTKGIVTLQDVLEAVTGGVHPAQRRRRLGGAPRRWLLAAGQRHPDSGDERPPGAENHPEEDKGRYHTLSGMMMLLLGRVPSTGDHTGGKGWRFEVVDMDEKRIDKVLAAPLRTMPKPLEPQRHSDAEWRRQVQTSQYPARDRKHPCKRRSANPPGAMARSCGLCRKPPSARKRTGFYHEMLLLDGLQRKTHRQIHRRNILGRLANRNQVHPGGGNRGDGVPG